MGAQVNPVAALAARNVVSQLARGGQPRVAAGAGAQAGNPTPGAGEMVQQELSQLRGADPEAILNKLKEMRQEVASLIPQTATGLPGVTRHLAGLFKGFDGAIKEAQQASQTSNAVGGAIDFGPAMQGGDKTGAIGPGGGPPTAGGPAGGLKPSNALGL